MTIRFVLRLALAGLVVAAAMNTGCGSGSSKLRRFAGVHAGGVLTVAFQSSDRAISSGVDGTARIWDISKLHEVKRFSGKQFQFQSIALSSSGDQALTPGPASAVRLWDIASGGTVREFSGARASMRSVALSPDGRLVAAGGQDTAVYVWDASHGKQMNRFESNAAIVDVAFAGSGMLRSIAADGTLCSSGLTEGAANHCGSAGSETVSAAAFSDDGDWLLLGGQFGSLRVWDLRRNVEIRKLEGVQSDVVALDISRDGKAALSGDAQGYVRLWDLGSGKLMASERGSGQYVSCVRFSPQGDAALFGTDDGAVSLWNWR